MLVVLIFIVLLGFEMIVPTKHALHMFQQNRYELKRYTMWLKQSINRKVMVYTVVGLIVLALYYLTFLKNYTFIAEVIACLFAVRSLSKEDKKEYIKPLVFTPRVYRQLATLVVLDIVVVGGVMFIFGREAYVLIALGCYIINWFMIYPMALINMPIEASIQKGFINKAKAILRADKDLTIVGITGSYGKTSSKNILTNVLKQRFRTLMTPASFNTPMGITITIREHLKAIHQIFVCEMGADKVGDIKFLSDFVKPKIGIVTSIGPQHLATFKSIDNIIKEKMCLIESLPSDGLGIINVDNDYIREYKIKNNCKIVTYGIYHEADYRATDIEYSPKGSKFNIVYKGNKYPFETKLLGEHNIMNILASVACAHYLGVELEELSKSVKVLNYVEHRLEVKKINGYTFVDNAFNSNPSGALMSLKVMEMMPNKRYIVTPGLIDLGAKQYEMNKEFGKQMINRVDNVILVGPTQTEPIYEGLKESGFNMENVKVVKTVKEAFGIVYSQASREDTILLENDLPDAFSN